MKGEVMTDDQRLISDTAVSRLEKLLGGDPESSHDEADKSVLDALHQLGFGKIVDAWNAADDRCGGFWYA